MKLLVMGVGLKSTRELLMSLSLTSSVVVLSPTSKLPPTTEPFAQAVTRPPLAEITNSPQSADEYSVLTKKSELMREIVSLLCKYKSNPVFYYPNYLGYPDSLDGAFADFSMHHDMLDSATIEKDVACLVDKIQELKGCPIHAVNDPRSGLVTVKLSLGTSEESCVASEFKRPNGSLPLYLKRLGHAQQLVQIFELLGIDPEKKIS